VQAPLEQTSMFDLSDHDYAFVLLEDVDLDAQLAGVRSMLSRNRQASAALGKEIEEIAAQAKVATGEFGRQIENDWVDHLHHSVYQDAANSMAAVGMLAPLLESLFSRLFQAMERDVAGAGAPRPPHVRDRLAGADYWNPRIVWRGRGRARDFVAGVQQLADASGLAPFLPNDYPATLKALFTYRNKMFHNGFEWPQDVRAAFAKLIVDEKWPADWFQTSTSGGEPWIFYMSDTLIRLCLETIDKVLAGAGAFVRSTLPPEGKMPG
jgi:hypothetical protein